VFDIDNISTSVYNLPQIACGVSWQYSIYFVACICNINTLTVAGCKCISNQVPSSTCYSSSLTIGL